jgi:hypothetical protein
MDPLAAIRPNEWELPLFIHILSAMTIVGALTLAAVSLGAAWSNGSAALIRLGFRALVWVGLPSWIALRASAQWIADEEGYADLDEPPDWIDIGFMVTDPGLLLLLGGTLLANFALRRSNRGASATGFDRAATVLIAISLLAYLVAVWAMTTQPG